MINFAASIWFALMFGGFAFVVGGLFGWSVQERLNAKELQEAYLEGKRLGLKQGALYSVPLSTGKRKVK